MDIGREVERLREEVREIRKYVNDTSHIVARMEEDINWIKTVIKWGFVIISFLLGLNIGL